MDRNAQCNAWTGLSNFLLLARAQSQLPSQKHRYQRRCNDLRWVQQYGNSASRRESYDSLFKKTVHGLKEVLILVMRADNYGPARYAVLRVLLNGMLEETLYSDQSSFHNQCSVCDYDVRAYNSGSGSQVGRLWSHGGSAAQ